MGETARGRNRIMRSKIAIISVILLVAVLGGAHVLFGGAQNPASYGNANQEASEVSMISLIANPEKYDGKLVRVVGVGRIEFEGNSLYFSKADHDNNITKNALWMNPDYEALQAEENELQKLNGKYVLIEGVFNSGNQGHFGMYSGAVERITRYALLQ